MLMELKHLRKTYPVYGTLGKLFPPVDHMRAVSDVSLQIRQGETYGLVGESGCGKTTTGRMILGLVKPDSGEILYQGHDLTQISDRTFRTLRKDLQMVFQDTLSSLNPRQRIGQLLEEPLKIHGIGTDSQRRQLVLEMLYMVGLWEEHYFRYPHELSGGQVQRLGIARAMILEPRLIVCDEPVSALDVSIQAQILNMMAALQKKTGVSLLFISHDIGVVRYISDRIGVMYLGTLVEEADTDTLFANPRHPYTQALFASVPDFQKKDHSTPLAGELPVYNDTFIGCVFHTRCPYATDLCRKRAPQYKQLHTGHHVACYFAHTDFR